MILYDYVYDYRTLDIFQRDSISILLKELIEDINDSCPSGSNDDEYMSANRYMIDIVWNKAVDKNNAFVRLRIFRRWYDRDKVYGIHLNPYGLGYFKVSYRINNEIRWRKVRKIKESIIYKRLKLPLGKIRINSFKKEI